MPQCIYSILRLAWRDSPVTVCLKTSACLHQHEPSALSQTLSCGVCVRVFPKHLRSDVHELNCHSLKDDELSFSIIDSTLPLLKLKCFNEFSFVFQGTF